MDREQQDRWSGCDLLVAALLLALPGTATCRARRERRRSSATRSAGDFRSGHHTTKPTTTEQATSPLRRTAAPTTATNGSCQDPTGVEHDQDRLVDVHRQRATRSRLDTSFADFDTVIAVYDGDTDGLPVFECNDDVGAPTHLDSELRAVGDADAAYYLSRSAAATSALQRRAPSEGNVQFLPFDAPPPTTSAPAPARLRPRARPSARTWGAPTDAGESRDLRPRAVRARPSGTASPRPRRDRVFTRQRDFDTVLARLSQRQLVNRTTTASRT